MRRKNWLLILALVLAAALLTACGSSNNSKAPAATATEAPATTATEAPAAEAKTGDSGDALARIRNRGKLLIGTEGNWSPWTYHDEKDQLTGLDVEIGKLIAEGLGVEAVFEEAPWDALLAGVDAGRFDIICNGVGYTEERAKSYGFTEPYVYTNKVLVVAEGNDEIQKVEDLKGKKTANSASSTYAALAESYGAELTPVDTLGETVALLEQGRVDATINAQVSISDYLREHPEAKIKIAQVLPGDPVAFPVAKNDTESLIQEINKILQQARENGKLAEISMKFFNVDLTQAAAE